MPNSARETLTDALLHLPIRGRKLQFAVDQQLGALKAAGYRILAPGEIDPETREACIAAIDAARSSPIHTASVERVNGVRQGHDRSVAAIRSLPEKKP